MTETEALSGRTVRPDGMMQATGWVGVNRRSRLHLADCDYFIHDNPPRPATEAELAALAVCHQCRDRMRRSLGDD